MVLNGGVHALAKTTDRFLWLGTTNGLVRFDGVFFERYKPEKGTLPRFPFARCRRLAHAAHRNVPASGRRTRRNETT
jgi:ligand-binding sensor domain-containing protein